MEHDIDNIDKVADPDIIATLNSIKAFGTDGMHFPNNTLPFF